MVTINQLLINKRKKKLKKNKTPALTNNSPQKKGTCVRVFTTTPKKLIQLLEKLQGLNYLMGYVLLVIYLEKHIFTGTFFSIN